MAVISEMDSVSSDSGADVPVASHVVAKPAPSAQHTGGAAARATSETAAGAPPGSVSAPAGLSEGVVHGTSVVEGSALGRLARPVVETPAHRRYLNAGISAVAPYLPDSVQGYLGPATAAGTGGATAVDGRSLAGGELVLHAAFHRALGGDGEWQVLLGLAYATGFQVWDLSQPGEYREVVSVRGPAVQRLCFLKPGAAPPQPASGGGGDGGASTRLPELHPLIAVQAATDDDPVHKRSVVKVYSLSRGRYVHMLRFFSAVHGIFCSERLLVVMLRRHVYAFHADTLQNAFGLTCFPNPEAVAVAALGDTWLACAADEEAPRGFAAQVGLRTPGTRAAAARGGVDDSGGSDDDGSSGALEARGLWDVAKDIATGFYYLREVGQNAVNQYVSRSHGQGAEKGVGGATKVAAAKPVSATGVSRADGAGEAGLPEPAESVAGTVIVRDASSGAVVAHFRSHRTPLVAMAFDRGGTLLATAAQRGQTIHVHRIAPPQEASLEDVFKRSKPPACQQLLFRLERGLTHAHVLDLAFSGNSQWLAATTAHGTTHLFSMHEAATAVVTGTPVSLHPAEGADADGNGTSGPVMGSAVHQVPPDGVTMAGTVSAVSASAAVTDEPIEPEAYLAGWNAEQARARGAESRSSVSRLKHPCLSLPSGAASDSRASPAGGSPTDEVDAVRGAAHLPGGSGGHGNGAASGERAAGEKAVRGGGGAAPAASVGGSGDAVASVASGIVLCGAAVICSSYMLAVAPDSTLHRYSLRVTAPSKLVATRAGSWDVRRSASWKEMFTPVIAARPRARQPRRPLTTGDVAEEVRADWLSYADMATHTPPLVPMWMSPQLRMHRRDPLLTATDRVQLPRAHAIAAEGLRLQALAADAEIITPSPVVDSRSPALSGRLLKLKPYTVQELFMADVVSMPLPVRRIGPVPVMPQSPRRAVAPDVIDDYIGIADGGGGGAGGSDTTDLLGLYSQPDYSHASGDTDYVFGGPMPAVVPGPTAPPIPEEELEAGIRAALETPLDLTEPVQDVRRAEGRSPAVASKGSMEGSDAGDAGYDYPGDGQGTGVAAAARDGYFEVDDPDVPQDDWDGCDSDFSGGHEEAMAALEARYGKRPPAHEDGAEPGDDYEPEDGEASP